MNIDYDKLRKVIEVHAKPMWEAGDAEKWPWRPGGGEIYVQDKVLKRAAPHLIQEELRENTKENLLTALKYNVNLLNQYDTMFAKVFIEQVPEMELRDQIAAFLYGPEDLKTRLRRFIDWARVEPIPDKKMKKGFNSNVCSYFLAMRDPRKYPYCKPVAYDSAVTELLGRAAVKRDYVERIIHCQEFYSKVLAFLEEEYGLTNGNLLDVHSMLYCFQHKDKIDGLSAWDRIMGLPKEPGPMTGPVDSDNPIYELLMDKHNVVLYGPPGTGKTREALILGNWWRRTFGNETVSQLTFHPSYSYEDFIEGFRPTPDGSGFKLMPGIFKKICNIAKEDMSRKYLVIVDEINRGDVARILGELITLVEGDKRGEKFLTILQQSGDKFYVPENLYMLGTMNTADKSISLMDLAIRRRFRFYYFPPDPDVLDDGRDFHEEVAGIKLSQLLIGLNQRLMDVGVDRDRVLGHSFFLINKEVPNPLDALKNSFRYEILPLVEEYCYADRSLMSRVLGELVDSGGSIDLDVVDDDDRFTRALRIVSNIE